MARIRPDLMMIDDGGGYEALTTVIAQAVAASPVVVDTPTGVKPSAIEALKVAEQVAAAVAPIVAPDISDEELIKIARQTTKVVVNAPEIIAAPAGQTVNTTTLQGIMKASGITPAPSEQTVTAPLTGTSSAAMNATSTPIKPQPATGGTLIDGTTGKPFSGVHTDGKTYQDGKVVETSTVEDTGMIEAIPLLDRGQGGGRGGSNTTPPTAEELKAAELASIQAARELAMTPYNELSAEERAAMSQKEKMDYIQAAREEQARLDAEERAINDPMTNPYVRPDAQQADNNYIYYYRWIGGSTTGSWQQYRAPNTSENQAKYGASSVGGETQASEEGVTGANTLIVQPEPVKDTTGKITGWKVPDTTATTETGVTPTKVIATPISPITTPSTTTATTTTPTTTTATTTTPVVTDANAVLIKRLQDQVDALTKQATTNAAGTSATQYNDRMGVYASMADRFNKYGLTGLANKIKELAMQGATEATITLQLQETPEYQQRFAANTDRLKRGLAVLTPAEYVNVEDSYRQVLRAYGLKQFDNDAYVRQFIANDMSPTELSNRVVTAVQRVQNADPALVSQLKQYYGIGAPDMVAYVLDPEQQFQKIERQIAASEIGVAAGRQGLTAGVSVAEQLAAQGVSEAEARKGYATIADILPTAEKLSDIYGTTLDGYRQAEGEQEVFNSLASAQRKRQKLTAREIAAFSGSSGASKTSLSTSSVGQF